MPINFNVSPYHDDFREDNQFYKPLFRPGVAVQARELNNLSAILQNQISKVGTHLFKNGAMVIPGQITFDPDYQYVKLVDPVSESILQSLDPNNIINFGNKLIIYGNISGVKAQIVGIVEAQGSEPTTLFVKYLDSGTSKTTKVFSDLEQLSFVINDIVGIPIVTVNNLGTGIGSAASIQEGIYFINGYLVRVGTQTLILEKYSNIPTVKVGLEVVESIITPEDDATLNDNAAGSPNYAAPGAHRYKIDLILSKRDVTSTEDDTFIELLRLKDGIKEKLVDKTEYSIIEETLARRTYDESGDYTVRPFGLDVKEHLNNGSNNGVYTIGEGGLEEKLAIGLQPAKAYVRGYEIETLVTKYIPVDKSRDTAQQVNGVTRAFIGNYLLVDRLFGVPPFNALSKITLYDNAIDTDGNSSGSSVGTARVRAIEYYSGNISASAFPWPIYKLYIFDIQLNAGKTIDDAKSYYLAGSPGYTGNILSEVVIRNPLGVFTAGDITGGVGKEIMISFNNTTSKMLLEPHLTELAISVGDLVTATGGGTGVLTKRTKLFNTSDNILIYPLPQNNIKSIRTVSDDIATTYNCRKLFTATGSGTGTISFTVSADEIFSSFSPTDYVLTVEGVPIDLDGIYTLTSPFTTFTIDGTGLTGAVRLSATIQKQIAQEKTKSLVVGETLTKTLPIATTISLGKADIYRLVSVIETDSEEDITNRYILDNGQRDTHYDIGNISLKPGQPNTTDITGITITFEYFTHSSGDYCSVDSYVNFNADASWYSKVPIYISPINNQIYSLRDCFDFRPRIDDAGTSFPSPGNLIKANSDIMSDFNYYLGRIDKIYLDFRGYFKVIRGTSSLNPLPPPDPKDGMLLYIITLNPYTFSAKDLRVRFVENKRYTMRDIGKLEKRIENVEYYTSLNLLEKETADLRIPDAATGLERFKNGFVVDPFTGHNIGDVFNTDYKIAIDASTGIARPTYFSDAIDLKFEPLESINYEYKLLKPKNNLITCKYTELSYIKQPYASRIENVNPYAIYSWVGTVELDPTSDTWKDTVHRPDILVNDTGAFDSLVFMDAENRVIGTIWNEWVTDWAGVSEHSTVTRDTARTVSIPAPELNGIIIRTTQQENTRTVATTTTNQSRIGIRTTVVPQVVRTTVDDRVVNLTMVPYIRSRYIKFIASRLKPNTKFFPFFDGIAIASYCKPVDPLSSDDSSLPGPEVSLGIGQRTLVSNGIGSLEGWFLIPTASNSIAFKTGRKLFRLTDDEQNSQTATSFADATYVASGLLETHQATFTSIIEPRFERQTVSDTRIMTSQSERIDTRVLQSDNFQTNPPVRWTDPLAQTFLIAENPGGVFLSKINLYFCSKDPSIPVTIQIREVTNGYPSQKIIPFSEVTLSPSSVNISDNGLAVTTFSFPSPVHLQNNQEYAFVVLSNSNLYEIFISRLGEKMIESDRIISQQPYAGSMFKSQNASTWTAEQFDDIKFDIYRCVFDTNPIGATIYFTNPEIAKVTLGSLPFVTSNDSSLIRIKHPDHGMPEGSSIRLGFIITDDEIVYNGIPITDIFDGIVEDGYTYGIFEISNVELDSYMVDVTSVATASGDVGPNGVIAERNYQMDILYLLIQQLIFGNTKIDWAIKTTTGKSIDGTQIPYDKDNTFTPIVTNENIIFASPRLVASPQNEIDNITGTTVFDKKSLIIKAALTTTLDNISPVIDLKRISAILIGNRVDSPSQAKNIIDFDDFVENQLEADDIVFHDDNTITSSGTDLSVLKPDTYFAVDGTQDNDTTAPYFLKVISSAVALVTVEITNPTISALKNESPGSCTLKPMDHYKDETAAKNGSVSAKYITRRLTLKDSANSLRVMVTAMRPAVSDIDVYYRVLRPDSNELFDDIRYVKMIFEGNSETSAAQNPNDFKEYSYAADGIGDFVAFALKIVLKSTDSTQVPLLTDFRAIALGT